MNQHIPSADAVESDRLRRAEPNPDACRYNWADLDHDTAAALWHELADWVDWLRHRYQLGSRIPACWYRHGAAVEALTALMAAHTAAYLPGPDQRDTAREDLVAWHLQWLWPVLNEITRISDFSTCGPGRCGYRTQPQPLLPGLDDFVHADLHDRASAPPEPVSTETASAAMPRPDLVTEAQMNDLLATDAAEAIEIAGRTAAVRYAGHAWVFSRISGGWVPERGARRRP